MAAHSSNIGAESSAVQTHLTIMQGIIQRMAENSRSCKVWCITIVSAVLVLVSRTPAPDYTLAALVPTVLFLILDTYYLALERAFRGSYDTFVSRLHAGELGDSDLYRVAPAGSVPRHFRATLRSFSIWPFYGALAVMIIALFVWGQAVR